MCFGGKSKNNTPAPVAAPVAAANAVPDNSNQQKVAAITATPSTPSVSGACVQQTESATKRI